MVELLRSVMSSFPSNEKKMFGSSAWFVNGNMMTGVFEDYIFVRLSESDRELLLAESDEARHFDPLGDRPMREYIVLPEHYVGNETELEKWLGLSFRFTSTLPVKKKSPRKKAAKKN